MSQLAGPTRLRYWLVLVGAGGYTCLMFIWFSLPAFLSPIIAELNLTGTQAGLLVGAVPLMYIPLGIGTGILVDRLGPGRSIAGGVFIYGFAQIGRSFAGEFYSILVMTLIIGVGATTITFGLPKLVSVLFEPQETGLPSSIYLISASAGSAAAFGIGRPIFGSWLGGWRPVFFWSGIVAIGYGLLWMTVSYRMRIDSRNAEQNESFRPAQIFKDLRMILSHHELRYLVIIGTMYLGISHGIQGWLPTMLEFRGFDPTSAGLTASLFVIAAATGTFIVPTLADRMGIRRTVLVICGITLSLGILGIMGGGTTSLTFIGVSIAGFGIGGISPMVRALPPEFDGIGARLTGTAIGFIFAVGEIGGFLGPVVIGTLHETTNSFVPGLLLLILGGLVVAAAGQRLRQLEQ